MNQASLPDTIVAALSAVQRVLAHFANQGLIIGGVAVSLLSTPRFTADVDAVVLLTSNDIQELLHIAKEHGLKPRIEHVDEFAKQSRVLLLRHEQSGVNVDISLGALPFEVEAVERGIFYQADHLNVRLPTPEDLIILKAVAHRTKDLADIEALVAAYPKLDWDRIQYWVVQFAEVLEMPEIWYNIAKLQTTRQSPQRRKRKQ